MQATENESEREIFPTSVSSGGGTVGQGFWSALLSSCVAQGQRGGEGADLQCRQMEHFS